MNKQLSHPGQVKIEISHGPADNRTDDAKTLFGKVPADMSVHKVDGEEALVQPRSFPLLVKQAQASAEGNDNTIPKTRIRQIQAFSRALW